MTRAGSTPPVPPEIAAFDPVPGKVEHLAPGLRRVLAPNPSPMTFRGTNSYLVGTGDVALIDPGPDLPAHRDALMAALEPGERISHIFVTHSHVDHSALAPALRQLTGAPVLAFGDSQAGRSPLMQRLAAEGGLGGGEGIDAGFAPDVALADDAVVHGGDWSLRAIWTPGHLSNHLSFAFGDAIFTGDVVMGWATSLISPPEGDLGAFMTSLARLDREGARVLHPGHGAPVTTPSARLSALIAHRRGREAEILAALSAGPATIETLTRTIYTDVAPALRPAASRNVFAHLLDLVERKEALAEGDALISALYRRL